MATDAELTEAADIADRQVLISKGMFKFPSADIYNVVRRDMNSATYMSVRIPEMEMGSMMYSCHEVSANLIHDFLFMEVLKGCVPPPPLSGTHDNMYWRSYVQRFGRQNEAYAIVATYLDKHPDPSFAQRNVLDQHTDLYWKAVTFGRTRYGVQSWEYDATYGAVVAMIFASICYLYRDKPIILYNINRRFGSFNIQGMTMAWLHFQHILPHRHWIKKKFTHAGCTYYPYLYQLLYDFAFYKEDSSFFPGGGHKHPTDHVVPWHKKK